MHNCQETKHQSALLSLSPSLFLFFVFVCLLLLSLFGCLFGCFLFCFFVCVSLFVFACFLLLLFCFCFRVSFPPVKLAQPKRFFFKLKKTSGLVHNMCDDTQDTYITSHMECVCQCTHSCIYRVTPECLAVERYDNRNDIFDICHIHKM